MKSETATKDHILSIGLDVCSDRTSSQKDFEDRFLVAVTQTPTKFLLFDH